MNVEKARSVLAKLKMKPNIKLDKSCKVLPADREYLQRLFTNPDLVEVSNAIKNGFPGVNEWTVVFYRCVDSLSITGGDRLRDIESRIFMEVVKDEIEGQWEGTDDQNLLADKKVGSLVRNAFFNYEKKRETYEISYF